MLSSVLSCDVVLSSVLSCDVVSFDVLFLMLCSLVCSGPMCVVWCTLLYCITMLFVGFCCNMCCMYCLVCPIVIYLLNFSVL